MKQNTRNKAVAILLIIFSTFLGLSCWLNRSLDIGGFKAGQHTLLDTYALAEDASDFTLQDDGAFYSETADPRFDVELNYDIKTIIIDVASASKICNAQIFYYNNEQGLTQEHSVWTALEKGSYYIQIPNGNYNLFRLDLTDQEGVSLQINSISFYKHRCVSATFWMIYLVLLGCSLSLAALLKEHKGLCSRFGTYRYFQYVLAITIAISCIFVYGSMINAGHQYIYYDIGGGDEPEAYIPLFASYIQKLQNHTLAEWTWNNGLGTSMSGFWGYMANPFTFLVITTGFFFGISSINTMVLIAQLLNILAVGLLCYKYLGYFDGKERSKAIASYIAAFSGYMILYAQHYVHAEFGIYIFATLILVEDILKHEKFCLSQVLLAIDCAFIFVCTVYLAYMIAVFTGIYTVFRLVQKYEMAQMKEAFIKLAHIFAAACIGFFISLPFILVVVNELLFNSDRVNSGRGLLSTIVEFLVIPYHKEAFATILLRLLSSNLQGSGNNFWGQTDSFACDYYAAPELFFSVFIFIFAAVYFATLKSKFKDKKQRLLRIIAGVLVAFVIFNRLGSAVFNALVAPFGRYTYLLMPLFAIVTTVSVDELEKKSKQTKTASVLSCIFTALVLAGELCYIFHNQKPRIIAFLAMADIALVALMVFVSSSRLVRHSNVVAGAISLLVFANVTLESYITVNERIFCSFGGDITDQDDYNTQDALQYIRNSDSSMYRIEKNYYDIIPYHDAYLQNYRGVSTYNSTLNANVKEFYKLYCNPAINYYAANSFWYSYLNVTNDIVQSSILGIKYYLSNSTAYDSHLFEKVYSNNTVSVYKNKGIDSFGVFYEHSIPKSEVLNQGYADRVGILSSAVVLEDEDALRISNVVDYNDIKNLLDENEVAYRLLYMDESAMEISVNSISGKDVAYLEFTTNLSYTDHMMIYFDQGDGYQVLTPYYYRGNDDRNQEARIAIPAGTKKIKFEGSFDDCEIENLHIAATSQPYVPKEGAIDINLKNDSHLQGTVDNNKNGYLLLPIPYEKGWSIQVDGEYADILKADSGFMTIFLNQGHHTIDVNYRFPGEKCGSIFAAIGVIIVFLECAYLVARKRKKQA